jgi:hypothetical protein
MRRRKHSYLGPIFDGGIHMKKRGPAEKHRIVLVVSLVAVLLAATAYSCGGATGSRSKPKASIGAAVSEPEEEPEAGDTETSQGDGQSGTQEESSDSAATIDGESESGRSSTGSSGKSQSSGQTAMSGGGASGRSSSEATSTGGRRWVVDEPAWDEQVLVTPAWDETVVDQAAWDERVYDHTEYTCSDGTVWGSHDALVAHLRESDEILSYSSRDVYTTIHHDAVTHVIHHEAVYRTVHHDEEGHWE